MSIGIIGGTGLYNIEGLKILESLDIKTPFGIPSAPVVRGTLNGSEICFLPRHGLHHELLPSEINYRANIWALKSAGVRRIISVSATGSLAEDLAPGQLVVASQYFDWTKGKRAQSFFGEGLVGHISTAEPACANLTKQLLVAAFKQDLKLHSDKTYACVEGPRLGSRAESFFLQKAGCHIVGMTNVPEAFLAREAQICYCTVAVVTDYDCWMEDPKHHASLDKVLELYRKSLGQVTRLISGLIDGSNGGGSKVTHCACRESLKEAIMTRVDALSDNKKQLLAFLQA